MLKNEKLIYLFFFNFFNFFIFIFAYKNLNTLPYFFFSIISLITINYTILNWKFYSELFFNILLYLGFWFKFSLNLIKGYNSQISEVNKFLSNTAIENSYSQVLTTTSISILTIFASFFLVKKIINFKKNKNRRFKYFEYVFFSHKIKFILIFSVIFIIIFFTNTYFEIALLGQKNKIFLIEKIYKFLLILFLPLSIAFIMDTYEKKYGKNLIILFLVILSFTLISTTLNSRAVLINIFPIFLIYFYYLRNNLKKLFIITSVTSILFLISFNYVVINRAGHQLDKIYLKKFQDEMIYLSKNRWVGISGMINVEYTKNKNYKKMSSSLLDMNNNFNFYEKNYYFSQDMDDDNYIDKKDFLKMMKDRKFKSVYTPGFMAFFYFSGSKALLLFLNASLVITIIFTERICHFIMNGNKFFLSLFSLILVWRIIHLGLYPINSLIFYLLLLSIPIAIYLLNYIVEVKLNLK